MEPKKYTQFGTFSVIILLPLFLVFTGMAIKSGFSSGPETIILLFLSLTFFICLLIFYQLTIIVDNAHVSFKLGIGIVGRSYKISDIKSCRSVTNSALNRIRIRLLKNDWLYNVSGLKAIELQFHNRKSVIRIGTNKPDEVCAVIRAVISNVPSIPTDNYGNAKSVSPRWIVGIITLLIPIALIVSGWQTKVMLNCLLKQDLRHIF